jgi:hypothetical protein
MKSLIEIPKMPRSAILLSASTIVISLDFEAKRRLIFSRTLFHLITKTCEDTKQPKKNLITCERRKTRSEFFGASKTNQATSTSLSLRAFQW